jgi:23S rRNA (guanosine2251-2'-O)-methyltransferase
MSKRKPSHRRAASQPRSRPPHRLPANPPGDSAGYWIYGEHAVLGALGNPARRLKSLLIGKGSEPPRAVLAAAAEHPGLDIRTAVGREEFARILPESAVHQGIAVQALPLDQPDLEALPPAPEGRRSLVVLLDQVTDPQNVGAILRSACAFGARAVVATDRNAAPESGALAKAASGALEAIPYIRVTNLVRALDRLKESGHWSVGLSADAAPLLADLDLGPGVVLILGSEGRGLRRLTAAHCDFQARLPTLGRLADLNVSNAAAVALYELLGRTA